MSTGTAIALACFIVAAVLFLIDGWIYLTTNPPSGRRTTSLGLFFLTLGLIIPLLFK